jgi:hypothetical protein
MEAARSPPAPTPPRLTSRGFPLAFGAVKIFIAVMMMTLALVPVLQADVIVWTGKGNLATASAGGTAKLRAEITFIADPATGEGRLLVATVSDDETVRIRTSPAYRIGEVKKGKATLATFTSWLDEFTSPTAFQHVFAYYEGKKKTPLVIREEGEPVSLPAAIKGSFITTTPGSLETITLNVKFSQATTQQLNADNATLTSAVQTIFDQYLERGYSPEFTLE